MPLGYDARFDLQYAHYWKTKNKKYNLGIMTGVSAGYMSTLRNQLWDREFVLATVDGDVLYHVTADIRENAQQVQVEVPLMFSMVTDGGFYFNIGPRFLLPILTPYKQVITDGHIEATHILLGSTMVDNDVMGKLSDDQLMITGVSNQKYSWTLTAGVELGYEFTLASGHSIGLGAYANYGVYNSNYGLYTFTPQKEVSDVIQVTPPTSSSVAKVDVYAMDDVFTSMYGHLDAGIKLSFNFNFK
jgi:hypothetical protein